MKNIKKILFCAGMAAYLTALNGCSENELENNTVQEDIIDTKDEFDEQEEIDQCIRKHYDENSLVVKTLSSGNKCITNESIHYSIRENFLNNGVQLEDNEYNHKKVYELFKFKKCLSSYDNVQIKRYFGNFIQALEEKKQREYTADEVFELFCENGKIDENTVALSFGYDDENNVMRQFLLWVNPGSSERIMITVKNENNIFEKENEITDISYEDLDDNIIHKTIVNQDYSLKYESNAEATLKVEWHVDKDSILEKDYACDYFETKFILRIGLEGLEIKLDEKQTAKVLESLNVASENGYDLNEYIMENNDLFIQLFGVDYMDFIEICQSSLKLKK